MGHLFARGPVLLGSTLAVVLLLAGCGGDEGGVDDRPWCERADGPYEGERAVFAAYCDAIARCDLAVSLGYAFRCRQECVQTYQFGLTCEVEDDESGEPFGGRLITRTLAVDEEQAASCIGWLGDADCARVARFLASGSSTAVDDDEADPVVPAECRGALGDPGDARGSGAEGDACERDQDCTDGLVCGAPETQGELVFCAACARLPGPGESCDQHPCRDGSYCNGAAPPICVAKVEAGAPCTQNLDCLSDACLEGACVEPRPDGEPCEQSLECASQACIEGVCDQLAAEGEACARDVQCATQRCYEDRCVAPGDDGAACEDPRQCWGESCYRGQCTHRRPDGTGPCDEDAHCASGSICYDDRCTRPDQLPVGAPCADGSVCITSTCIDGACASRRDNGEPCGSPDHCISNQCEDGLCGLADGAACWSGTDCRAGRCPNHTVCTAPKDDGEGCVYPEECLGWACVEELCFTPRADGDPCGASPECVSGYCEEGTCALRRPSGQPCTEDAGCVHENCDLAHGLCGYATGESCGGGDDDWCQGHCEAGVCADDSALGGPCNRDAQCPGYCSNGACVLHRPFGDACGRGEECEGGVCAYANGGFVCRGPGQCLFDDECAQGEFCDSASGWPPLCAALRADGEACDDDDECLHYCQSVCPLGEACRDECVRARPYGARCEEDAECADGVCRFGSCALAGSCGSDDDCAPPETCNQRTNPPTCAPPAQDGGSCRDNEDCDTGWCSPITDTCGVQPTIGDPCQPFECTPDAYCLGGTCAPRKGPGDACDDSFFSDAECLGPYLCKDGACRILPLECAPSRPGDTCAFLRICTDDAYCDLLDGFTCKPRSAEGESCSEPVPRLSTCEAGTRCDAGACEAFVPEGASCAAEPCDPARDHCDPATLICQPLHYRGEPCQSGEECMGGECDQMRCDGPCRLSINPAP